MARPGSDKQSLVGTVLTPASGCALSGAGNRTGKVASAALAWIPQGTMPRSPAFLGWSTSNCQRRRVCSIETASPMPLELRS